MKTIYHDVICSSSLLTKGFLPVTAALILSLSFSTGFAQDDSEQGVLDKLWEDTKESSSETWEAIKSDSKAVGEFTKDKTSKAWDATKDGAEKVSTKSGEIWEGTKEVSGEAWDATKSASKTAAEYTTEKYNQAKESLSGDDDNAGEVVVEEKSTETVVQGLD